MLRVILLVFSFNSMVYNTHILEGEEMYVCEVKLKVCESFCRAAKAK